MRLAEEESGSGRELLDRSAGLLWQRAHLVDDLPPETARLVAEGRLWLDGLNDPQRGSEFSFTLEGERNPWQLLTKAFAKASSGQYHWREIGIVLPPIIIGALEKDMTELIEPLERLSQLADVFLYCDGGTPLLSNWPFATKRISIASYAVDFLLQARLQELGLSYRAGPHLMQGGYRKRVAVKLAINAQGLEGQFSKMDHLAMALVAAAHATATARTPFRLGRRRNSLCYFWLTAEFAV